jgi:hypothetical protein
MREFDLLNIYPNLKSRYINKNSRTIKNRIIASYKDKEFYDGNRSNGYGGYSYDGRWKLIADRIFSVYKLKSNAKILQIGCDKGYLIYDIKKKYNKATVKGIENSKYAISKAPKLIKKDLIFSNFVNLPFKNDYFDFVLAIGPVYSLNLTDALKCLKEINRVGKGKSFITLGAYKTDKEFQLFRYWTLLGSTILSKTEWKTVLKHVNYKGDYKFNTSSSLNLKIKK